MKKSFIKRINTLKNNNRFYSSEVKFETKNNWKVVTLNRPKQLNSLNLTMVEKMKPLYEHWDHDNETKGIILQGEGDKAFCAGGDIKAVYETKDPSFFQKEYQLNQLIGNLKIPHVSIIDGITMGGGVGLSVHGKYRIATENTVFAMPETKIGFFCDVGGSYFLSRLPKNFGMFLGLTGMRLKGKQNVFGGVATHFCPKDEISNLKERIIQNENIDDILKEINKNENIETKNLNLINNDNFPIDQIEQTFSKESLNEIIMDLESQNTEWSKNILSTLKTMSPTSLNVVFRQIRNGKNLEFKECFSMELKIARHMMTQNDFFEGVRALLIDKDQNPKWIPETLEEVKQEDIDLYFA
eukprot:gene5197-8803_t